MLPRTYAEAFSAYSYARQRAFALVRGSLVSRGVLGADLAIRPLDEAAVETWEQTWRDTPHWSHKGGFPWHLLHRRYCRKPRNFHVSVWYGDSLCGLAVGRLSDKHERLALQFMSPVQEVTPSATVVQANAAEGGIRLPPHVPSAWRRHRRGTSRPCSAAQRRCAGADAGAGVARSDASRCRWR
jgi:hypothetical protein